MIVRIILRYMKTIKTSLLIISLLLFTIPLFGQISGRRISVRFRYGSKYTHRVIDTCKLFITYQLKLKWAVAKRDSIREVLNCADVPVRIDTVDISQVLL